MGKLSFREHGLPKVCGQARLYGGLVFSPAVLTAPLRFLHGRWGHRHKTGAGVRASSSFRPLEPQSAGAGLPTAAPRFWGRGVRFTPGLTGPWTPPEGPGPPALSPLPIWPQDSPQHPFPLPAAATPGHSGLRPIGRPGSICPYLARLLQAASTPSPAPAGLSLSLRLFEVWLWGPGGRRFKRTFWLSHFFNGSRAVSCRSGRCRSSFQPWWSPPPTRQL